MSQQAINRRTVQMSSLTLHISMSLYQILNPQGSTANTGFVPVCQTSPLCSHKVCNTSLSISGRIKSLVDSLTLEEKILNIVDASAGSARLGLPPHEWWNEATHGVGSAPGVQFTEKPANFSYATSFPAPISIAASFDDDLVRQIAGVIGKEGRAFANNGFSGFDFWAPNINPFRDPRWGRGQETPGEDSFVVQSYIRNFIPGLQGNDPEEKQVIATCKHYAVYDLETGRYGNDYNPSQQDLADYFLAPFKTCVRDTGVGSVMCAYNAVDGIPSCASEYLLEQVLRKQWNFTAEYNYVVSDCDAVTDIWRYHNFTDTEEAAASVAINAGTDLECGSSYLKLNESLAASQITARSLDRSLTRLYSALFTVGFFDGGKYSGLDFSDVSTPEAQALAYQAAVEGMTLLKNDKNILPIHSSNDYKSIALIGPFANATTQMQGDYSGIPPYLISPLQAFENHSEWEINYSVGTGINNQSAAGFASALAAAKKSDLTIYLGGIDNSIEAETLDRTSLDWPGNQLDMVTQLSNLHKPLIVVQFGGGQLDDSSLLRNEGVQALVWAGYPSQSGGAALLDVLTGKKSIAGRLPITQYPANYTDQVSIFDINLRPALNGTYPGRTYKWYRGNPVIPFGYGLHYTHFDFDWEQTLGHGYNIQDLVASCQSDGPINDSTPFASIKARLKNVGSEASDYVGLLFILSEDAGPAPRPNRSLVSYTRIHDISPGSKATLEFSLTLGSLARADDKGNLQIYPGKYKIALDISESLTFEFFLRGSPVVIDTLPMPDSHYDFTVPVHIEPPSTEAHS